MPPAITARMRRKTVARAMAATPGLGARLAQARDGAGGKRLERVIGGEARPRIGEPGRDSLRGSAFQAAEQVGGGGEIALMDEGLRPCKHGTRAIPGIGAVGAPNHDKARKLRKHLAHPS